MGVLTEMSEAEVLNSMMRSHESMMAVLKSRHRSLQIIYSLWHNKDLKVPTVADWRMQFSKVESIEKHEWSWFQAAVDSAVAMNDLAVIVDLLSILTLKPYVLASWIKFFFFRHSFAFDHEIAHLCSQADVEPGPVQFPTRSYQRSRTK